MSGRQHGRVGTTRVAVLTVIDEEFEAARGILDTPQNLPGTNYWLRANVASKHDHVVVVSQCAGRSNVPANEATEAFIEAFKPGLIVLMGIAGGISGRGVGLGDVVLADFVDYYEYGKLTKNKFLARREPHDHPSNFARDSIANPRRRDTTWTSFIQVSPPVERSPSVVVGNIVAGEKLLMDRQSKYQQRILRLFDKAIAVDMESWGFCRAVYNMRVNVRYNPQCLIVRAISDLVDGDEDNQATREEWRIYAAQAAAAFTRAVVDTVESLPVEAGF